MVSLNTHNIIDYVIGAVLLASPYFFGFADVAAARDTFLVLGTTLIAYSLLTQYRFSIFKWIPIGMHMALDVAIGVITLFAPWAGGYRDFITPGQTALHVILGLGAIGLVVLTRTTNRRAARGTTVRDDIRPSRRAA